MKKEITKLKIITPLTCHSDHSPCHSEALAEESLKESGRDISAFSKPQYDNSTFTPPFAIPKSWVWVKLEDICEIIADKVFQIPQTEIKNSD